MKGNVPNWLYFLVSASPGIAIYLHGVYRWKSWLWFRRKNW